MAMAPSGGQGPRAPYNSDNDYGDYGANGQDQFAKGAGQRFDARQRSFAGNYYNEEQAHFGPPGTGPLPGDAYYCDDQYFGGPRGGPPPRSGRGSSMMMQDSWYRGGGPGGIPPEFEDDGYGVTSFSDEDADELDLR